jgi:predicted TIM-barrel fold metal-dependent hydrolase
MKFYSAFFVAIAVVTAQTPDVLPPIADLHQHLFSPALVALISATPPVSQAGPVTARDLISILDLAGIQRAAVLSTAYIFSQPSRNVENDYEKLKAENDWTASQIALYPDRLVGLCGVNPLKDYAVDEVLRCSKIPELRHGLKLHFGNSVVDYHNAQHIEQARRVFRAANDSGMAIVVHMRASTTARLPYGAEEARVFLNDILPAAPDVPVQIAHLAGAGGYTDPSIDPALRVFVEAIRRRDPQTRQLWFDVSGVVSSATGAEQAMTIATRIREIGVQRILYGTDGLGLNSARDGWASFVNLPLSADELRTIANNLPPYMR